MGNHLYVKIRVDTPCITQDFGAGSTTGFSRLDVAYCIRYLVRINFRSDLLHIAKVTGREQCTIHTPAVAPTPQE